MRFVVQEEFSLQAFVGNQCKIERMGEQVRSCCTFGPFVNCTVFALVTHRLCEQNGVLCKTGSLFCEGGEAHRYNFVFVDDPPPGSWCFYEPQTGKVGPCDVDPKNPTPGQLCKFYEKPLNPDGTCPCKQFKVSDDPLISNRDPLFCQTYRQGYQACLDCCNRIENILRSEGEASEQEIQDWYRQCSENCRRFER